jgi:hypothetical protein
MTDTLFPKSQQPCFISRKIPSDAFLCASLLATFNNSAAAELASADNAEQVQFPVTWWLLGQAAPQAN